MSTDTARARADGPTSTAIDRARSEGVPFLAAAIAFFVGGGVVLLRGRSATDPMEAA